ncbi:unnamed protein product, partial [marine sediment metagenome]
ARMSNEITTDPDHAFGRPCIAGTNIPAEEVYGRFVAGDSITTLLWDYGVSQRRIEAAIRHWIKHKEEL